MLGPSEGTVLLTKTPGPRVGIIDGAPFPEVVFRYGSADVELCVQQIDEMITAVGILLAETPQPADIPIGLPGNEQLGDQCLTEAARGLS